MSNTSSCLCSRRLRLSVRGLGPGVVRSVGFEARHRGTAAAASGMLRSSLAPPTDAASSSGSPYRAQRLASRSISTNWHPRLFARHGSAARTQCTKTHARSLSLACSALRSASGAARLCTDDRFLDLARARARGLSIAYSFSFSMCKREIERRGLVPAQLGACFNSPWCTRCAKSGPLSDLMPIRQGVKHAVHPFNAPIRMALRTPLLCISRRPSATSNAQQRY